MFTFTVEEQKFNCKSTEEQIVIIETILQLLDKQNSKGYINSLDLTKVPLISELLPYFISGVEYDKFINGEFSMESYKWMYNLIILTLYFLTLESKIQYAGELTLYNLNNLNNLEGNLFSRLDSSIRYHLVKTGISITNNCYIGLDTEFKNESKFKNTLVSTQLTIASRSLVKIPKFPRYTISSLDVENNKLHRVKKYSSIFNYQKVESSMQQLIEKIRRVKHGNYDELMIIIDESLKSIKGLKYFDSENYTLFSFPISSVQPFLTLGKSSSLEEILLIATNFSNPIDDLFQNRMIKLITEITAQNFSIKDGKDNLLKEIRLKS